MLFYINTRVLGTSLSNKATMITDELVKLEAEKMKVTMLMFSSKGGSHSYLLEACMKDQKGL